MAFAKNYKKNPWKTNESVVMGLLVNTTYRSEEEEIMDDLNYNGAILHDSLNKLAKINKWLGGNQVTLDGLKTILKGHPKAVPITIIDIGCGGGDILRAVARFGQQQGYRFKLIGIDANSNTISYARSLSYNYDNISYESTNIFSEAFKNLNYDVVLSTLFLHHFKEDELISFLTPVLKKANLGIVVNDLHRHKLAYYLFKLLSITISNKTITQDGLTSVLRGFKRNELEAVSKKIYASYQIHWRWAFRYQWILKSANLEA